MAISAARSSSPSRTASGLNHRDVIDKLAHLGGESSKLLFDTLAQWNHALSQTSIAGILPAANSNDVPHVDDSSSNGGAVSLDPNVVGIDLSARRPQRPTYRGPKKRRSDDDGMEVGHG
jgi:hypothetical protein